MYILLDHKNAVRSKEGVTSTDRRAWSDLSRAEAAEIWLKLRRSGGQQSVNLDSEDVERMVVGRCFSLTPDVMLDGRMAENVEGAILQSPPESHSGFNSPSLSLVFKDDGRGLPKEQRTRMIIEPGSGISTNDMSDFMLAGKN